MPCIKQASADLEPSQSQSCSVYQIDVVSPCPSAWVYPGGGDLGDFPSSSDALYQTGADKPWEFSVSPQWTSSYLGPNCALCIKSTRSIPDLSRRADVGDFPLTGISINRPQAILVTQPVHCIKQALTSLGLSQSHPNSPFDTSVN